jgi:hypothetical protein
MNSKTTGSKAASTAGRTLASGTASSLQKSLSGSVLAQTGTGKVTGKAMETKASAALQSNRSSPTTKSLAGSLVSQSNKKR